MLEKREVRRFTLLRMGYFHRDAKETSKNQGRRAGVRLSRTEKLELRLGADVYDLLDLFVDGRIPLDRRVALARETLNQAKAKADALRKSAKARSRGKKKTAKKH